MDNKKAWCDRIGCFVLILMFLVICWLFVDWATSPEAWYDGEHDGDCEIMLYQGNDYENGECHCKERLIAADKERFNKQNQK